MMGYGEHKTVLRDARLRTTATEDAIDGPIIMPYTTNTLDIPRVQRP